jgi:nitrogen fixation-related uncharacterized protein
MSAKAQTSPLPLIVGAIIVPLGLAAAAYVYFQPQIEKIEAHWFGYGLCFLVGVLMTVSAVYALRWSARRGQLRDFEKAAASIFDDAEPIGRFTDSFPGKKGPANKI